MERELNQINVVPLVDVMLVLLVTVLTTATFISTGQIPVELARASSASDSSEIPIVVTLGTEGTLYLNDRPVSSEVLSRELSQHPIQSAVILRADRTTVLDRFVAVIDQIKLQGFQKVSLEVART
ncbi:MAG: biopolymer transporter ExbD [Nitrospira sp.]